MQTLIHELYAEKMVVCICVGQNYNQVTRAHQATFIEIDPEILSTVICTTPLP